MYKLFVGFRKLDEFPTILEAKRFARECDYTGVFTLIEDNYRDSWYKFNDNNKTTAMNNSINKNGISVCQSGEEKYVYFDLTPDQDVRDGIVNTTTVTRWMVSYLPPLPRLWSSAERNETSG